MPITLNCPKCHKPFRVRDDSIGMRVKCPTCGAILQVPASLSPASIEGSQILEGSPPTPLPGPKPSPPPPRTTAKMGQPPADSMLSDLPPGPTAGPPSLPMQAGRRDEDDRRAAATGPLPPIPNVRRPTAGKARPAFRQQIDPQEEPAQVIEDADGWRSVRSGLRWVQIGLFFQLLAPITALAIAGYTLQQHGMLPADIKQPPAGLLGKANISLFDELTIFSLVGGGIFALLLSWFGLMKCLRVPASAKTRGVVSGSVLLVVLNLAAFVILIGWPLVQRLATIPNLPHKVVEITTQSAVLISVLSVIWYIAFLSQAGLPLRTNRVMTDVAYSSFLLVVLYLGAHITNEYYPLFLSANTPEDQRVEVNLKELGVKLVLAALVITRLMSITGIIRSAIRRWFEEHEETLGGMSA